MERDCDRCGHTYQARRSTSRYCSPRCRKQASRHPKPDTPVTEMPDAPAVFLATQRELRDAGSLDSALGHAALKLAALIDESGATSGSAPATLVREWRVTLAEAVKRQAAPTSLIDELRKRREQRSSAS